MQDAPRLASAPETGEFSLVRGALNRFAGVLDILAGASHGSTAAETGREEDE